ncbi:hypothetical protein ASZ90_001493 [hydrocarbon metagenome]|uniref:Uncharacterized protein n=1 Tax=hydrocarbon metagenome TaxID=938273 RepID=A0A0W8G6K9_9ZZZZ
MAETAKEAVPARGSSLCGWHHPGRHPGRPGHPDPRPATPHPGRAPDPGTISYRPPGRQGRPTAQGETGNSPSPRQAASGRTVGRARLGRCAVRPDGAPGYGHRLRGAFH